MKPLTKGCMGTLLLDQKHALDLFLERGAISKEQYDKSLGDLTRKMGINTAESSRDRE